MTPATGRATSEPRSAGSEQRRHEIVRHAAVLFDKAGYHTTTMEDIAVAVGIRKPTLYHYFKSKDEILFWIHEEVIDLIIDRHEARLRTPMTMSQNLLEMMADILELLERFPGHARVFFEHVRELPEQHQAVVRAKRERYQRMLSDIIDQGIQAGEFREVDPKLTTLAILGMCNWAYQWFRPDGRLRSREIAYSYWDLALRGMTKDDNQAGGDSRRR